MNTMLSTTGTRALRLLLTHHHPSYRHAPFGLANKDEEPEKARVAYRVAVDRAPGVKAEAAGARRESMASFMLEVVREGQFCESC